MASNRSYSFGPVALTNTYTTNIFNPGTTTGGVNSLGGNLYFILKWLAVINKTAGAVTFRLYKGATGANAAGTEYLFGIDQVVAANSYVERYPMDRFDASQFLVGGASALTSLVVMGAGELGIA